eukprot:1689845-Amphidinium_carterae.1
MATSLQRTFQMVTAEFRAVCVTCSEDWGVVADSNPLPLQALSLWREATLASASPCLRPVRLAASSCSI